MNRWMNLWPLAAVLLTGCATTETPDGKVARRADPNCQASLGSNICRRSDKPDAGPVNSVSGEDLRRSSGPIVPPQGTVIGP